jgi:hypothetical protein
MADHTFCRMMLAEVMKDVKKHVSKDLQKEAWTYKFDDRNQEFQIPSVQMYWYGSACCGWQARYEGWNNYLRSLGVEGY